MSLDLGATWSNLTHIEPVGPPEASWAMPVLTPTGRVYAFYDYNSENVTMLPGTNETVRADMLGHFMFKYTDDWGKTWSDEVSLLFHSAIIFRRAASLLKHPPLSRFTSGTRFPCL